MGEILPDGTIQGYQGYCQKCGKVIDVNMQGNERYPLHECADFISGCQVSWTYRHYLNSKQSTLITKEGTFIKFGKRRIATVHFKGNKHPSKVPLSELNLVKAESQTQC